MSRILFITSNRIGDAVLSTGALNEARRRVPNAAVTVVAGPLALPLFRAAPGVDCLVPLEKRPGRWRRLWALLRRDKYALAVDLRGSLITSFLNCRQKIVHRKSKVVRHKVDELGALMGVDQPLAPVLHIDAAARAAAAKLVPDGQAILALGAGANFIGKQWSAESFAEVARRLAGLGGSGPMRGATIVLLGGPNDADVNAHIQETLAACFCTVVDATNRIDLLGCAALLERARLFIGNDSGLMHLAAAAGAPTLGLFGPSPEAIYGPWGDRTKVVRGPRSYERIILEAGHIPAITYSLMDDLAVGTVERAALDMLAESDPRGRQRDREWAIASNS